MNDDGFGGPELYAHRFQPRTPVGEVRLRYGGLEPGEKGPAEETFRIAGRILGRREHGKAVFLTLRDGWDDIQLYGNVNSLGEESFSSLAEVDLGDILGVEGGVFCTRRGELSVRVDSWELLTKSHRSPPEKFHGLTDKETRYRQRYADLIANPEVGSHFRLRSVLISAMRRYLEDRGFLEVETPILQPIAGGALARPFVTHHNALDADLFLRIAPELYLKRLLVGGFDRVFEIGKSFRNEGISHVHNPEFTMLELYWSYVDYTDIMELVEHMVASLAHEVLGGPVLAVDGEDVDLTPPWRRVSVDGVLAQEIGMSLGEARSDPSSLREELRRRGVDAEGRDTFALLVDKALKHLVWPALREPTFVMDYPLELSPLAKQRADDPSVVERFQPVVGGREIGNAFSELNDPAEQRRRFGEQMAQKAAGDEEAHALDEDFIRALEYGMPPAGGLGIGVDRLVMLFLGLDSIRDALLFPQLRPEHGQG